MPLLQKSEYGNSLIAVWKTTEPTEELLKLCHPAYRQELTASGLKGGRLAERAAVRALLSGIFPENPPIILYREDGSPYIENGNSISISHTKGYAAVMISGSTACGIDIELISGRALRIRERYMNSTDLDSFSGTDADATLCWSAKETAFKATGRESYDFKNKIFLTKQENFIVADSSSVRILIHYYISREFVLTWTEGGHQPEENGSKSRNLNI